MRIHFISNSLYINSGFGKVTRYIALGLKKLGHDISMTGLQTSQKADYHYGIQCLPVDTEHVDETTQLILNIQKTNPDIVFYMGQLDADLNHLAKVFPKTVSYSPVEGSNIPMQMANDMLQIERNGGLLVAQCRYGQQEMRKVGVSAEMVYHGYDPNFFYPIPNKNFKPYCYNATSQGQINTDPLTLCKQECFDCSIKTENKGDINCPYWKEEIVSLLKWDKDNKKWSQKDIPISKLKEQFNNKFIYQFTGQNFGIRKQIPRLLKAYSILINESRRMKDNTILAMHTLPISIRGVDLIKIITELEINQNVIFTYGTFGSSGWSENAVNIWYNMADINLSASSSEGFCILPDSPILTLDRGVQKIKDIRAGDKVLTHKGRFMRVFQVMKREYNGDMIKINSHKIGIPIILTPEHRVLCIRTVPCTNKSGGIIKNKDMCKPGQCYYTSNGIQYKWCKYINGEEPYRKYKTEWISAENLEIGDFLTYPRPNENVIDIDEIKIRDYIDDFLNVIGGEYNDNSRQSDLFGEFIEDTICMNTNYSRKYAKIPAKIKLDGDLMKLFGYFIAEGDIAGERQIEFTFNINEIEYIEDVERIMQEKFGLDAEHIIDKKINNEKINIHILRYSNKVLSNMFQNMFCPKEYIKRKGKGSKSNIVRIPPEFLNLPLNKLAELIKTEWRGDGTEFGSSGGTYGITTTSETLAHQLLYILSRFGMLASLQISEWNSMQNENWSIRYNIEIHGKDIEIFNNIIGQKNKYRNVKKDRDSKYLKGKNLYYTPIKNIEIIKYNGEVWNLEVEEDNSYVSSIVLHNCLPVLEGFATGLPMIAPNCSSFTELIGDINNGDKNPRGLLADIATQHVIQDGSYRSLVNEYDLSLKMKTAYVDKDKMEIFSKNAIKFAQQYTWEKLITQWNDLILTMK